MSIDEMSACREGGETYICMAVDAMLTDGTRGARDKSVRLTHSALEQAHTRNATGRGGAGGQRTDRGTEGKGE